MGLSLCGLKKAPRGPLRRSQVSRWGLGTSTKRRWWHRPGRVGRQVLVAWSVPGSAQDG